MNRRLVTILMILLMGSAIDAVAQEKLFLGDNYYHKNMVKTFKALKEHKLDKAARYKEDIEKKAVKDKDLNPYSPITDQLYPVWQLSDAMMMNIRDGRGKSTICLPYDPWNAYGIVKKVSQRPYDVQNANLLLQHKDLGFYVSDIKSAIETNLIDSVRKVKTEAEYDKLIGALFDYPDMSTLMNERERVAYDVVKNTHALSECKRYLNKYGNLNQTHFNAIQWRRDSIAYDELGYTAAACKQYLTDYPHSRYRLRVEERLHKCAFDELDQTVDACKEYLKLYPASDYYSEVKALQEKYAFRDAQKSNSVGAYGDFVKEYPYSEHVSEARQLMQDALLGKYFNSSVSLNELYRVCDNLPYDHLDGSHIKVLYANLLLMPTSAVVNNCDGLVGRVEENIDSEYAYDGTEYFNFNKQGLLTNYYNSRTDVSEQYDYDFDPDHGFVLLSKTDASGKTITYTTQWDIGGSLREIRGSDGSRYVYSMDYYNQISYYKGSTFVKTDNYDSRYRLIESKRSGGIVIEYEYNQEGDVISMTKKRGNTALEETTYEYSYSSGAGASRQWTTMWQYNNGSLVVIKHRQFNDTVDRVQSVNHRTYKIDWSKVKSDGTVRSRPIRNESLWPATESLFQ